MDSPKQQRMKILFAVQGTGNGHVSRARDIYPILAEYGEVDVLISGIQADVDFPYPVKYRCYGMSFIFGKKGGIDIKATAKKLRLGQLFRDIKMLPVKSYDLIINDFEPITAWACKRAGVPCIALSHQVAVLHPKAPRPKFSDFVGELFLRRLAPHTAAYGFHFKAFAHNIYTPVIRQEVRDMMPTNEGHYTVYLPAYDDDTIIEHLSPFREVHWQVFSKHNKEAFNVRNIHVQPIDNDAFIESMVSSAGVLCGAGFEGPAEAMFLGKKVMAIPMHGQYEQQCNAAGLADLGVPIIPNLDKKYEEDIRQWIHTGKPVQVSWPNITHDIIAEIVEKHARVKSIAEPIAAV